jgi:dTMP kinase
MAFISFEGIEGCGKSTQARRLAGRLGPGAVLTQEPGGTAIGIALRNLLLDPRSRGMVPVAELLLYMADRAQHVAEVIRPALAEGRSVVSDRYLDSSIVYQGCARELGQALVRTVGDVATGGLQPDLKVLLDVSVETGLSRVRQRGGEDRLEAEVVSFHERVREGYRELVAAEPDRWLVLDGGEPEEEVARRLASGVEQRLGADALR